MSGFQVVDYGIRDSGILGTGKRVSSSWGSRRLGLKMGGGWKRVEDGWQVEDGLVIGFRLAGNRDWFREGRGWPR